MTLDQLIAKLQTIPNPSTVTVLGDTNNHDFTIPIDVMGETIVVAVGQAYKLLDENCGVGAWIGSEPWRDEWAGLPLTGVPSVYIGSGFAIKTPIWQLL